MSESQHREPSGSAGNQSWSLFWFGLPTKSAGLTTVQFIIGCISVWFFCSHFRDAGFWFGEEGILSPRQVAGFLDDADLSDAVTWQWSPLYLTDSAIVVRIYLVVAACLAGLTVVMTILSARKTPLFGVRTAAVEKGVWLSVWLAVVWLANRSLLISGTEEIALSAATGYLALAQWPFCRSLATRLLQIHACLLLGSGGLQMLASEEWWDGTGSVAVAAPVGRRFLNLADWISEPWIHESLTHLLVLLAIAVPVLIWTRLLRCSAMWAAVGWCGVMALLSSQWIYFPTLAAMFLAFRSIQPSTANDDFAEYSGAADPV